MKILLAVSGGADSMYMASRAAELMPGARFGIAHCNFNLRGSESDGDEAFVREWAGKNNLRFHSISFNTTEEAAIRGISIEMAARELRYAWFTKLCDEEGYDAVAVAHNANDNAETLVLNLLRGTGSRGVRGMEKERTMGQTVILRPILGVQRVEIEKWLRDNGVGWRNDRTNAECEYKRNKVRNEVFPVFAEINPNFINTLNADMRRLSQVDDIAEDYFKDAEQAVAKNGRINIEALKVLKHWKYVLFRLTEGRLNEDCLTSLITALESGKQMAGKRFGEYVSSNSELIPVSLEEAPMPTMGVFERPLGMSLKQPSGVIIMDADLMPEKPVVRHWEEGDWMVPLGMKGRKKLSDLFVDLKYSAEDKRKALVVEHPKEKSRVAALLYDRIDDSVKVTGSTRNILRFSK